MITIHEINDAGKATLYCNTYEGLYFMSGWREREQKKTMREREREMNVV